MLIFPVGVGGADLKKLSELSATPPKQMSGMKFREFFKWVSDSMSATARSVPGENIGHPIHLHAVDEYPFAGPATLSCRAGTTLRRHEPEPLGGRSSPDGIVKGGDGVAVGR